MRGTVRSGGGLPRALVLATIACALLLRILIPQGWMPVRTGGGWIMTLCTGTGPMRMAMPMDMAKAMDDGRHAPGRHDPADADHPCAFAACAAPLHAPDLPTLALPALLVARWSSTLGLAVTIGRGLAAPPPPATGPPAFS